MSLWTKIKHTFKKGAADVSETTVDLVDASAEVVKETFLKISKQTVDVEEVGRLQVELKEFREMVKNQMADFGEKIFQLFANGKESLTIDEIEQEIEELRTLNDQLTEKESITRKASENYEKLSISRKDLKDFKEELEAAGGTLERLIVDDQSPYIGKILSEIEFPPDILVGLIVREDKIVIPSGDTEIRAGDKVILMGKKEQVAEVVYRI